MKKFWAVISILTMFVGIDFSGKAMKVEQVWARAAAAGVPSASLFVTLNNKTDEEDSLVSVSTEVADKAVIQEITHETGEDVPHDLKALSVATKQSITMKPHHTLIALHGLRHALIEGETFPATFTFTKAGPIDAKVHVQAANAMLYEQD